MGGRNWAWAQFSKRIPVPEHMKTLLKKGQKVPIEVCSKAIDGDFNTQPERMSHSWNVLGICINHWHRPTTSSIPSFPSPMCPVLRPHRHPAATSGPRPEAGGVTFQLSRAG